MLEAGIIEGRIIHFVKDGKCDAGIVVRAKAGTNAVALRSFGEGVVAQDTYQPSVDYDWSGTLAEGTWHWPLDHTS